MRDFHFRSYESVSTTIGDSDSDVQVQVHKVKMSSNVSRSLRRQHSDGEKISQKTMSNLNPNSGPLRQSNSEMSLGRTQPPPRSLSFSRPIRSADMPSAHRDYPNSNNKRLAFGKCYLVSGKNVHMTETHYVYKSFI